MNDQEIVVSVDCVCCLEPVSSKTSKKWQRYLSPCCYQAICNDCQADLVLSHSDGSSRATFSCPNCQLSLPGTLSNLAKPTDRFVTSSAGRVKVVVTKIANITLLCNSAIQAAKDQLVEIKANHDQILSQGIFTTQQVADLTQQFQTVSKPVLKVIDSVIANNNSVIKQLASLESYCQGLEAVLRPGCA